MNQTTNTNDDANKKLQERLQQFSQQQLESEGHHARKPARERPQSHAAVLAVAKDSSLTNKRKVATNGAMAVAH